MWPVRGDVRMAVIRIRFARWMIRRMIGLRRVPNAVNLIGLGGEGTVGRDGWEIGWVDSNFGVRRLEEWMELAILASHEVVTTGIAAQSSQSQTQLFHGLLPRTNHEETIPVGVDDTFL